MDKPREGARRKRIIKRVVWIGLLAVTVPLVTVGLSRLKPAAPSVEDSTTWKGVVERGLMVRQTRGLGSLVPQDILFIPALTDGRVEKIVLRPGAQVRPDSIVMILTNPELELAAEDLRWQVKAAEATMADLKVKLETARLDMKATVAKSESEFVQAQLKYERESSLAKEGLAPDLNVKLAKATSEELAKRFDIDKKRLEISAESVEAQLAAQHVAIEKVRAALELKKLQVDQLKIRAGAPGVLQEMTLEEGQRVAIGAVLAKIAQPWRLKAVVKVPETHAKDVMLGQSAEVDTHNGVIPAKVSRIDPAAQNGTVTVDLRLEGELPKVARPDLSVEGTIELERLPDVMHVQLPVNARANSLISLFLVDPSGKEAVRVPVKIGRISVNTVEVMEGLKVGDRVILSDMSAWDAHNRVRLN